MHLSQILDFVLVETVDLVYYVVFYFVGVFCQANV